MLPIVVTSTVYFVQPAIVVPIAGGANLLSFFVLKLLAPLLVASAVVDSTTVSQLICSDTKVSYKCSFFSKSVSFFPPLTDPTPSWRCTRQLGSKEPRGKLRKPHGWAWPLRWCQLKKWRPTQLSRLRTAATTRYGWSNRTRSRTSVAGTMIVCLFVVSAI